METLSSEELIKQNALLHRQHILHGYPKGQRPKISKAKRTVKPIYARGEYVGTID